MLTLPPAVKKAELNRQAAEDAKLSEPNFERGESGREMVECAGFKPSIDGVRRRELFALALVTTQRCDH